jgi:ABC-type multidrug transport system ATPase subunit
VTVRTLEAVPGEAAVRVGEKAATSGSEGHSTEDPPTLALRGVCKRWRAELPPVLEELDLTLQPGTRTWVGGRNGVGKTTMLRIAAGLIHPDRGQIEVCGLSPGMHRAGFQRLVSFLPAGDRGLYARLTVRRQLEFCARISLVPRRTIKATVQASIDLFELAELANRRVDRLSMGQRQRVRIAMTFLPEPHLVLLDEPLTSLDEEGSVLLEQAVQGVVQRDGAVLWCSPSGENLELPFDSRWTIKDAKLVSI